MMCRIINSSSFEISPGLNYTLRSADTVQSRSELFGDISKISPKISQGVKFDISSSSLTISQSVRCKEISSVVA